jgi:RNA-directed DNA polymerase
MEKQDEMIKTSINLRDLRRKIYLKAKADISWRFWGIYIHVTKLDTLREAFRLAKRNNGAPGIDGISFSQIEKDGLENFLEILSAELKACTYLPQRNRIKEIPKDDGGTRNLSIPTIRDRVVQGAVKLILEPIFEADFQSGSFGYRPKRTAHEAVARVADAIVREHTKVIDLDLKAYFDNVNHCELLKKFGARINDDKIMRLLKLILKTSGKKGIPQGGPLSPLASNIYLNEVDKMLEKAKKVTTKNGYSHIEYVRFADDIVVMVDNYKKWDWLYKAAYKRLLEELSKLGVAVNVEKTKLVDLNSGGSITFLGFEFRRARTKTGRLGILYFPKMSVRSRLLKKLKEVFRRFKSQPVSKVIEIINPVLRGWVNYFRIGTSSKRFVFIKDWVEKKVRRHLMRQRGHSGYGWMKWSRKWIYDNLNLYSDYRIIRYQLPKAKPLR